MGRGGSQEVSEVSPFSLVAFDTDFLASADEFMDILRMRCAWEGQLNGDTPDCMARLRSSVRTKPEARTPSWRRGHG